MNLQHFLPYSLLFLLLSSCEAKQEMSIPPSLIEQSYSFVVASDLHYLSPSLADPNSSYFHQVINNADGKMTDYCDPITDAFLAEVIKKKPDALILTGDLTWNGAKASHEDLMHKLKDVEDAGINVFVIPGNHDLGAYQPARFSGDTAYVTETANADWFREQYQDFGLDQAQSFADDSYSYLVHSREDLYLLFLDANSPGGRYVSQKTMSWLRSTLSSLPQNARLLTFTHQNLLVHNARFTGSTMVANADQVLEAFNAFPGKEVNFAGHLHIQNIATSSSLDEIDTGSLSVYPCLYGTTSVTSEGLSYQAQETDVATYAKDQGLTDKNLLSFATYGRTFFDDYSSRSFDRLWGDTDFGIDSKTAKETFLPLHYAYFSGNPLDLMPYQDNVSQMIEHAGNEKAAYLESIVTDLQKHPAGHLTYSTL